MPFIFFAGRLSKKVPNTFFFQNPISHFPTLILPIRIFSSPRGNFPGLVICPKTSYIFSTSQIKYRRACERKKKPLAINDRTRSTDFQRIKNVCGQTTALDLMFQIKPHFHFPSSKKTFPSSKKKNKQKKKNRQIHFTPSLRNPLRILSDSQSPARAPVWSR